MHTWTDKSFSACSVPSNTQIDASSLPNQVWAGDELTFFARQHTNGRVARRRHVYGREPLLRPSDGTYVQTTIGVSFYDVSFLPVPILEAGGGMIFQAAIEGISFNWGFADDDVGGDEDGLLHHFVAW